MKNTDLHNFLSEKLCKSVFFIYVHIHFFFQNGEKIQEIFRIMKKDVRKICH